MGSRGASSGRSNNPFPNSLVQDTLYHGTNVADITEFSTNGRESNGAIFFADDADYAEEEAYVKGEKGGQQTMYEVKLNIKNPMTVTLKGDQFADPTIEKKIINEAKAKGYDSVIFKSDYDNPIFNQTFYAVFSSKQVKIIDKKKLK